VRESRATLNPVSFSGLKITPGSHAAPSLP
jgi:hypothetical protein